MLGWLLVGMVLFSILAGGFSGRIAQLSQAAMTGCGDAITLVISLAGTLCLWSGLMQVAERSGLTDLLARAARPLIRFLLPGLPADSQAIAPITLNLTANLLGLGNAATPLGLAAISRLEAEQGFPRRATPEMTTFVVLNTASLQLIPTTNALLRLQAGSAAPMEILPAVWISSLVSVACGVLMARLLCPPERRLPHGRL